MKATFPFGLMVWSLLFLILAGCPAADEPFETVIPENAEPGRWIVLDGAPNTRDIGGYVTADGKSVRHNTVYRSGTLSRLTADGCEAFAQLGVRRVIDFRNRLAPSPLFDGDKPCVFAAAEMSLLPVLSDATDPPEERYMQAVQRYSHSYRQAFQLLADEDNLPLLYHCAAGKDRTGIMTVLVLTLLGVDREQVIADYELSEPVAGYINTEWVITLLDEVDRQGGIEPYLANIGVSLETQATIRELLLE